MTGHVHTETRRLCDRYAAELAALDPIAATNAGVTGHDERLTDYTPEAHEARAELARRAVRALATAVPVDDQDRVAAAVLTERAERVVALHEAGLDLAALNVIDSPAQELRMVFELMPKETAADWHTVLGRLSGVPDAMAGVRQSLAKAAAGGRVAALRQVTRVADQCENWATTVFGAVASDARAVPDAPLAELATAARAAAAAYVEFSGYLRAQLAPLAPPTDAVGEDDYRLLLGTFLGDDPEPREIYEWGWDEFDRIGGELQRMVGEIGAGRNRSETAAALDADPACQLRGRQRFLEWVGSQQDQALDGLSTHFEITEQVRRLENRFSVEHGGVPVHYTPPTADLSRPGQIWWSAHDDQELFATWRTRSVLYHEGAPGHHLQATTAVAQGERLTRFQRELCDVPGHREGWALYAERLMDELGYFADPADRFGMLVWQHHRAARVVLDTGLHLELPVPRGVGFHDGERWTPRLALAFLLGRTAVAGQSVLYEVDRYLGWPGQAPSYKLGERAWLAAREEVRRRRGGGFDLASFHRRALEMGPMGLRILRDRANLL